MTDITAVLLAVAPSANASFVAASKEAGAIMARYGITSPAAQAHLIAQCAHETGGFRAFEENLNYWAQRLTEVWPSRFPSIAAAKPYAKNPKALAIHVYGDRMGNIAGSDDGWKFRGSGALHHTGRAEFTRVRRRTGVDVVGDPGRLRDVTAAGVMWNAACSYFVDRGALAAADKDDLVGVTKKVNGGTIGIADRGVYLGRAKKALAGLPITTTGSVKTTSEKADDAARRAKQGTVVAPAGGTAGGTGTAKAGADYTTAIIIGLGVAIVLGLVAVALWRRAAAARAKVEVQAVEALRERVNERAALSND